MRPVQIFLNLSKGIPQAAQSVDGLDPNTSERCAVKDKPACVVLVENIQVAIFTVATTRQTAPRATNRSDGAL